MRRRLVLADSAGVRYAACSSLYFAQGIPYGLMHIAMPAWLASKGASAGAIASYLAIIVLPWAFKLLMGPLMERYTFLPMGRRRPWILGAQTGLVMSLLALMAVQDPLAQIGLLTLLGLLINSCAATQDVAVDGMAIELVPEREQGRLNAFMGFGKAMGWAGSSAVSGLLLAHYGIAAAGLFAAAACGLILLGFLLVQERQGERLLPWSRGSSSGTVQPGLSFAVVFRRLNEVLWLKPSLILFLVMFIDGVSNGYGHALMPIAAIKLFNYTTPEWSQLVASMGLIGACMALGFGPLIDRYGARRMLLFIVFLVLAHAFLLAGTQHMWNNSVYVRLMLSVWILLSPVTMVCAIALAMNICSQSVSSTQFAIYMSTANLGSSLGAKIFGLVAEDVSYAENYLLLGVMALAMFMVLFLYRFHAVVSHRMDGA